jgi:hypothetical protein
VLDVVLRVEPAATHNEGALLDAGEENLLLDFRNGLLRVVGMLLVRDLQPVLGTRVSRRRLGVRQGGLQTCQPLEASSSRPLWGGISRRHPE